MLLEKAKQALVVARNAKRLQTSSSVSRAYYAVHNAMSARFGVEFPTIHGEIVRPAILTRLRLTADDGADIQSLYEVRRRADYRDYVVPESEALQMLTVATILLDKLGVP